ncbi:hypothetical protein CCHR01_09384 [Colletotrichum chrysophilum]|uniref:Uncharacterized protein n=1 Tax=Colletotrichum chrysophilum TaxID=1836956 RepID=A0AAD9EE89_9PEZI|nr:hypothetical protein CCHR01_09384 [Colletotrichum chrysophilum]
MPSRSQSSWVPQQVAIDYQRNDLLRRELDRIFGREQYRIHGIRLDHYQLSLPRRLEQGEIDSINRRMAHYRTQWEPE